MVGYRLELTCAHCAGELVPESEGRPIGGGLELRAVARCSECGRRFVIVVRMLEVQREGEVSCGTDAGYQRHCRRGEKACDACLDAHRLYRNPEGRQHRDRELVHA